MKKKSNMEFINKNMFKSSKIETYIQRSDSAKSNSDKPSSLQDTKLRPSVDREIQNAKGQIA